MSFVSDCIDLRMECSREWAEGEFAAQFGRRRFLTIKEAGEFLGLGETAIKARIRKGYLRVVRIRGGGRRVRRGRLISCLDR